MFMRQLKVPLDYFKGKNVLFKKWVESINDEICVFKKNEKILFVQDILNNSLGKTRLYNTSQIDGTERRTWFVYNPS